MENKENTSVQEEIIQKEEEGLNRRQRALKRFLEDNFESGKFFTIEEVCKGVKDQDGYWYVLNTDPYVHDKCKKLSDDVRTINWTFTDGYKVIIKDSKGGIKLAENRKEFDNWWDAEHKSIYLNNLKAKVERDGIVPIINQRGRVLDVAEMKPVEVYKK